MLKHRRRLVLSARPSRAWSRIRLVSRRVRSATPPSSSIVTAISASGVTALTSSRPLRAGANEGAGRPPPFTNEKAPVLYRGLLCRGLYPARNSRACAASSSQLDTLALQLALNGVEGDLKREYRKPRPTDDGGASKDQERRHLNSPQNGVATRIGRDGQHPPRGVMSAVFFGIDVGAMRHTERPVTTHQHDSDWPQTRTTAAERKT